MKLKHTPTKKEVKALQEKMGINKIKSKASLFFFGLDHFNFFKEEPFEETERKFLSLKNPKCWGFNWLSFFGDSYKYGMGGIGKYNQNVNVSFTDVGSEASLYQFVPWIGFSDTKFSLGVGTCGGIKKGLKIGDIIICTKAFGEWEGAKYRLGSKKVLESDKKIVEALEKACKKLKIDYKKGKIFSVSDVFLEDEIIKHLKIKQKDFIGVDHENYAGHVISENYKKPFGSIMLVSDLPVEGENYYLSERAHKGKERLIKNISKAFNILVVATEILLDEKNLTFNSPQPSVGKNKP